jgi:hypothetical protein
MGGPSDLGLCHPQLHKPPVNAHFSEVTLDGGAPGLVRASGELGDEWVLIGDDVKIQER